MLWYVGRASQKAKKGSNDGDTGRYGIVDMPDLHAINVATVKAWTTEMGLINALVTRSVAMRKGCRCLDALPVARAPLSRGSSQELSRKGSVAVLAPRQMYGTVNGNRGPSNATSVCHHSR